MRAITALPGEVGTVGVEDFPEPAEGEGALLVRGLRAGCGDRAPLTRGPDDIKVVVDLTG